MAPPSMGLSRQEYWSGVPLPSRGSSRPGIEPESLLSPTLAAGSAPPVPLAGPRLFAYSAIYSDRFILWAKAALCYLLTASLFCHLLCGLSCFPSTGGGGAGLGRETPRTMKQWSKRFQQLQQSKLEVCKEQTSVCAYRPQTRLCT